MDNPQETEIQFNDALLKKFFTLDLRADERRLFLSRMTLRKTSRLNTLVGKINKRWQTAGFELWQRRFKAWERHVNVYGQLNSLAESGGTTDKRAATWRIDKLNNLLTALDSKIGMALNVNSLLLAGVSFFLPWIPSLVDKLECSGVKDIFFQAFYLLTFTILALLLLSLAVLLRGFRRVVWGDLGSGDSGSSATAIVADPLPREREYAGFLIISVARRTNAFRISTYVTRWALRFLTLLVFTGAAFTTFRSHWCRDNPRPPNQETTIPKSGNVSISVSGGTVQIGGSQTVDTTSPMKSANVATTKVRHRRSGRGRKGSTQLAATSKDAR